MLQLRRALQRLFTLRDREHSIPFHPVTVFHLLRHGEHGLAGRVLVGRMPGVGLSERGRGEIEAVAERLAGAEIDALYASPLQRTRETAEIVSRRLDLPIGFRHDLLEIDFGEWTGSTFDAIRDHPAWPLWNQHRSIAKVPGGETMRQVQRRVVEALMELHQTHPDENLLLVSHGDVIRAALVFALGMPLDLFSRLEVSLASISTIRLDSSGIRVLGFNERPSLPR
jgi:broad specificity phosphatase PhoE